MRDHGSTAERALRHSLHSKLHKLKRQPVPQLWGVQQGGSEARTMVRHAPTSAATAASSHLQTQGAEQAEQAWHASHRPVRACMQSCKGSMQHTRAPMLSSRMPRLGGLQRRKEEARA